MELTGDDSGRNNADDSGDETDPQQETVMEGHGAYHDLRQFALKHSLAANEHSDTDSSVNSACPLRILWRWAICKSLDDQLRTEDILRASVNIFKDSSTSEWAGDLFTDQFGIGWFFVNVFMVSFVTSEASAWIVKKKKKKKKKRKLRFDSACEFDWIKVATIFSGWTLWFRYELMLQSIVIYPQFLVIKLQLDWLRLSSFV